MSQAVKSGDKVKIHYTGRFKEGQVFDSSQQRGPLEFEIGSGSVIPGFENAITGMKPGDKKEVTIPPEEAYGQRNQELFITMPKDQIPPEIKPEVGMQLKLSNEQGQVMPVMVTEVGEESITLDANHPLAGKELVFDIELLEIV